MTARRASRRRKCPTFKLGMAAALAGLAGLGVALRLADLAQPARKIPRRMNFLRKVTPPDRRCARNSTRRPPLIFRRKIVAAGFFAEKSPSSDIPCRSQV